MTTTEDDGRGVIKAGVYGSPPSGVRLVATSVSRYNGGAKTRRLHGSSTITRFLVRREEDGGRPELWVEVEAAGPTPGERATRAKAAAYPEILRRAAKAGPTREYPGS